MHEPKPQYIDPLADSKRSLRRQMRATLDAMPAPGRALASKTICERLLDSVYFAAARTVLAYAPLENEVDITPVVLAVLRAGRTLLIPRVDWASGSMTPAQVSAWPADLVSSRFGVREPAPHLPGLDLEAIDLALVPGLAYDLRGGRLGRGAGFYDRFFAGARVSTVKVGLAFEQQIVDRIPMRRDSEIPDVCMDAVLTEQRTVLGCPAFHEPDSRFTR